MIDSASVAAPTTEDGSWALVATQARPQRRPHRSEMASADLTRARVAQLYSALAPAVLGYFRSQGAAEPEDLVGEVFVQVTRYLPRFRGPDAALRRWIFTIAHHRLVDDHRRRAARPRLSAEGVPDAGPVGVATSEGLDAGLISALQELTPLQREVVVLRFVADLPLDEVARLVRRRRGAVKSLQARALAHLAHTLRG